jgi:hypothetical protein
MRAAIRLLTVAMLVVWPFIVEAQDEEEGTFEGWEEGTGEEKSGEEGAGEEGKGEEGEGEEGSEEADPWAAPKAAEKAAEEEEREEQERKERVEARESGEYPSPNVVMPHFYPIAEIDRPLALSEMTLETRASLNFDFMEAENWFSLQAGAGFGITNEIEAGIAMPISFAPKFRVGAMNLYGLYELPPVLDEMIRFAGQLQMYIPLSDAHPYWAQRSFVLLAEVPVKFKIHDMFAVVAKAGIGFSTGKKWKEQGLTVKSPTYFHLHMDMGSMVQPIEQLALWVLFGFHGYLGSESETIVPLTCRGQYTLMGDLDLIMDVGFMDLTQGVDWVQVLVSAAYRLAL